MPNTPLTRRAINATWWSTLEISARYGVQFLVVTILARLLAPADFGLIAMVLVFTSIGTLLVDSGFSTSLIQRQRTTADDETTMFWFTAGMSIFVSAVLWLSAPWIARFYSQPILTPLMRLLMWILPLSAICSVPDAKLTQQLKFRDRAKAQIIAACGSALVAITLAWSGYGVWSLVWQSITAVAIRSILVWQYSGWRPIGRFRISSFRDLFDFGGYMLLSGLLDTAFLRLQSLLIGKLFDARQLGYYSLAQNAQNAPTTLIGAVMNRVGLPLFSSVADQPAKLVGALRLSLRVALFVFVPCMIGIALAARPLIEILYGRRWAEAAPILTLLALSAAFWPLHVLNLAALNAQGHSNLFFRLELIKKTFGIILILACSPGGVIAIAGAVMTSSLIGVIVNTWYTGKLLGYTFWSQMMDQRNTFLLTMLAAGVGWAILHWNRPGIAATIAAFSASACTYLVVAWTSRDPTLKDIILLFSSARARS